MALNQPTEFKRGDIYWVRMDGGVGSEMGAGRPALIVSSDAGNKTSATMSIVWLTTQSHRISMDVDLGYTTKRRSWAKCSAVTTVDKTRFGDYIGRPTDELLANVDEMLAKGLGLPYIADKDELLEEIESQQSLIDEMESEIQKLKLELTAASKMYGVALDQLVELRVERDIRERTTMRETVPEELKKIEKPKKVDLNTCEPIELIALGVPPVVASCLIESRPYRTMEEMARVNGVTSMMYSFLKGMCVLSPVEVEVKEPEPEVAKPKAPSFDEFRKYPKDLQERYINELRDDLGATATQIAEIFRIDSKKWLNYINAHPSLKDPVKYRKKTPENIAKVEAYMRGTA